MTCMLVLSGRVELMVMHGGVKNNYEHNVDCKYQIFRNL